MRTAPAWGSVLHFAFSGLVVVVVPLAMSTTSPSHQIFTPIFLRFSPLAIYSFVGLRQYLRSESKQMSARGNEHTVASVRCGGGERMRWRRRAGGGE
jgi:hypothetical protein